MDSLPETLGGQGEGVGEKEMFWGQEASTTLDYPLLKEQFEREFLVKALSSFDGRVNQTALHTKIPKMTLLRKLEKYKIDPKEYVS